MRQEGGILVNYVTSMLGGFRYIYGGDFTSYFNVVHVSYLGEDYTYVVKGRVLGYYGGRVVGTYGSVTMVTVLVYRRHVSVKDTNTLGIYIGEANFHLRMVGRGQTSTGFIGRLHKVGVSPVVRDIYCGTSIVDRDYLGVIGIGAMIFDPDLGVDNEVINNEV